MNRTSCPGIYGRVLGLVLLCFLAAACAPLDLGTRDIGTRTYGRCGVVTLIGGQVYKKARHTLPCRGIAESPGVQEPRLMLHCSSETPLALLLQTGKPQFHPDKLIKVRYRFNQRPTVEQFWGWLQEDQTAGTQSDAAIDDFLRGMAARERLVFEIGDRSAAIPFTGDTIGAINDFQRRCAALENKRARTPAPLR